MERKSKKEGIYVYIWDSLIARLVTNLLAMQETQVQFLGWEGPPCWRKWQPTPVSLPGKSHGQRSLVVYSPWGRKELDTTEQLSTQHMYIYKTDALCCTVETTQNCKATMCSVTQSCPVLCNLMDCSPLGSSVHGILQANTGVGSHSLLQGIFLMQRLNTSLLHCRQIPYHLNHQGSPTILQ